ncbi:MAG: peptidase M24 [Chloroflexi bacterium RBG_13_50_21]|nr:MAG: peptidase M24 [Chloroflexi bacterium RBG_13_50_21]
MTDRNLGGLYLQSAGSFAWATCGAASYINTASTNGLSSLLITQDHQYLLTTNVEAPRLEKEGRLMDQGWEFLVTPWHASQTDLEGLRRGLTLASDGPIPGAADLSADLARVRANLTPEEGKRFQDLGRYCARAMQAAIQAVKPGQTEYEIGARLSAETEGQGVQAIVNLIATDERIFSFRHPLPTAKRLEKYAMLILCGRKDGLVCSVTRLVHFGPLSNELKRKAAACSRIDAEFIAYTRPGQTLGDIFEKAAVTYAATGFPDEWRKHHQGGASGYEPREYLAVPGSPDRVTAGQAYAWNPSITGCKSEDTILVGETNNEILTEIPGWPSTIIDGIARPSILVV